MSDLRNAQARGLILKTPHYNSIFNYLENPDLTPILRTLITQSSLPLKSVEVDFAVDSSGFTTSRFHRWFDHKYGKERQEHEWVKCHLMWKPDRHSHAVKCSKRGLFVSLARTLTHAETDEHASIER
jgi:hypothetical protein